MKRPKHPWCLLVCVLLGVTSVSSAADTLVSDNVPPFSGQPSAEGAASSARPRIASSSSSTNDDTLHAVWQDFEDGEWGIFYARSIDAGQAWSTPLRLSQAGRNATDPTIVTNGEDLVYVAWHAFERGPSGHQEFIRFSASFDNGASGIFFPIDVNLEEATPPTQYATAPQISAASDDVHVTWTQENAARDGDDVFVWSMSTGSIPFKTNLYRFQGLSFPAKPRVETTGDRNVYLAFLEDDGTASERDPYLSHALAPWASDSWSAPAEVPGNAGLGANEPEKGNASELRMDAFPGGLVVVGWVENRQTYGYVNYSIDAGQSWASATLFHQGSADPGDILGDVYDFDMALAPVSPPVIGFSYGVVTASGLDQYGTLVDGAGNVTPQVIGSAVPGSQVLPRTSLCEAGGELHVAWIGGAGQAPTSFEDIYSAGWALGSGWSTATLVNDAPGVARSASPDVTAFPSSSQAHVVFDDRRNFQPPPANGPDGATEIYHAAP